MSTQRESAPNTARRNEASRRAILMAAFDLVGEVGYAKLSIEGIAARAGVGKQTIYRWWPSKGAVLFDAFLALAEGSDDSSALPDTGDLQADLTTVLRATVEEFGDPRFDTPMRALSTEIAHDPALAEMYAERLDRPMRELKKERLRSAQRTGELPADLDLDVAIDLVWGPLHNRWLHRSGPLTPEYAEALVATALNGLRHASASE
ncbi:AcrR family transcriptional regulator [Lipingzhangella halophila]|uniref:AcrR family transcriptional regulator n=1 Tax=Lipingzhangella halophila TaxID=1783352 RepID=A0A7W7W0H0_9ACTN|nr:TetR/AcrR family transcriptional regulator [Lipingzhangella halophila]MBB4929626.1 AcrR family transcriptional regulator [Lipingzhangella halophila]